MGFDIEKFECAGETEGETQINLFLKRFNKGEAQRKETLRFIAEAFSAIAAGEEPKKALKLIKPKGRKKKTDSMIQREVDIAKCVFLLHAHHGFTVEKAFNWLGKLLCKSHKRIEAIYYEHKETVIERIAWEARLELTDRFRAALPQDVRKAIGHWPAGYVMEAAERWKCNPELSAMQILDDYWKDLKNTGAFVEGDN